MIQPTPPCRVGEIDFEVTDLEESVERTIQDALRRDGVAIHFPNAWSITLASQDSSLVECFRAGRNYPDGKPLVWVMRWLRREIGTKRPERVGGHAFFERAIAVSVDHGLNHYFMGSTPDTLEKLEKTLLARFPRIHIVGKSSPPYKEHTASDYEHELQKIRAAKPDIVWVGLGTPRQDQAASYMATRYPAVFACVGAVFDFTAGNLRDAPNWMQEAGLAWLFRFIQEPRRLFYRYTYGNAKFIKIAMNQMRANRSA